MMNVIEVMGSRSTKYGGVEKFMGRLIKENPDLRFYIIYNEEPYDKAYVKDLTDLGASIYSMNMLGKGQLANLPRFYRLVQQLQPIAVHFHFSPVHALWGPLCRCMGVPLLFKTSHSCVFNNEKNAESLSDMSLQHRIMMRWGRIFKIYNQNLCVSNYVLQQFKTIYGDYGNNTLVYLGTENPPNVSDETKNHIKQKIGAIKGKKILLTVLFADKIKGCDVLLQALPYIKENYQLVIVGMDENSSYTQKMKELAQELGVAQSVFWVGITNDVHNYLSVADVFIQPSRTEALSLAAVEAMSHGLPVVASNVGGLPEVASMLFENEDSKDLAKCISALITDPTEQKKQGEEQQKRWKDHFYIGNGVRKYSELYHFFEK